MAKPSILLVAAKWWPLSARMAIAFLKNGCSVSAICPIPHPMTFVQGLERVYRYRASNSLASLRRAIKLCRPDAVVPCDDGAASQCRALLEIDIDLRPILERSLGPSPSYSIFDSRFSFLSIAESLGLRVPVTRLVSDHGDVAQWYGREGGPAVLKVNGDSGGNGVRICQSLEESLVAFDSLRAAPSRAAAFKRALIDCDPLAHWLRQRSREITVQEYIEGRPANTMVAAWQGRVLSLMSVMVVVADGPTGAATIVRVINDERMRHAAQVIATRLHMSGFFGLDFVIDSASGIPYLIEINPRCTQLGHIEFAGARSLAATFVGALHGQSSPEVFEAISSQRIAFFPQALAGGTRCKPYIEASFHDAPVGHPRLLIELMRSPWPQRQMISRLYHAFNVVKPQPPLIYEELSVSKAVTTAPEFAQRKTIEG